MPLYQFFWIATIKTCDQCPFHEAGKNRDPDACHFPRFAYPNTAVLILRTLTDLSRGRPFNCPLREQEIKDEKFN